MPHIVAVFAPYYPPAYLGGGPIRSLHTIASTAPPAYSTYVITRDRDLDADVPMAVECGRWLDTDGAHVWYTTTTSFRAMFEALRNLRQREPEILYLNSFFDPHLSILPQLLVRFGWWRGARRVIAVRGEFREPAMALKARKKRLYLMAYRFLRLHRGVTWHATSADEAADIRRIISPHATIIERPDEGKPSIVDPATFTLRRGPLRLVFLGRIVPIKGILDALTSLRDVEAEVEFDIYGPTEDKVYAVACHAAAQKLPSNVRVRFCGLLEPHRVGESLSSYDAFLMPTHSENFGHVIGEALASGLPVLVRDVTPWTPYIANGGGVVVTTPAGWAAAVQSLAAKTPTQLRELRLSALDAYRAWQADMPTGHLFDDLYTEAAQRERPVRQSRDGS